MSITSTPGFRALLIGAVLLVGTWLSLRGPLSAITERGVIEGLEEEPFFPPADPRADAVLAEARATAIALAANETVAGGSTADLGAETWILSWYFPTAAAHRGPHTRTLGPGGAASAVQQVFAGLPESARTPAAVGTSTFKVDLLLTGRRPLPPNGGYSGAALDPGLDGIELRDASGSFLFLPAWSAERAISRRKIAGVARKRAATGGWSEARAQAAPLHAFRTRSWVEAIGGGAPARPTARSNVEFLASDAATLREAIKHGVAFLVRETDPRGKITYRYSPDTDTTSGGYNMLRHAGTAYSMFQVYRLLRDDAVFDAAARAMGYYRDRMREDRQHPGEWFILDKGGKRKRAKLGGAGLGLLAWVEMEKARPGSADHEAMFGLARHILRMQNPDGSFESFYDWDGKERGKRKSTFYPGEAMLGLVRLHQLTGEERWLDAAERGADYLVNHRWVALGLRIYTPLDHWLIQALEELDRVRPDRRRAEYAFAMAAVIARHKLLDPQTAPPDLLGGDVAGLSSLPSSANAGSFGEALSAAARLERRTRPDETRVLGWAKANVGMQLRNQFTEANSWFLADPDRAHGGFRFKPNDHEIGNDYVQHNISGLFGLLQLIDADVPDIGIVVGAADRSPALLEAIR